MAPYASPLQPVQEDSITMATVMASLMGVSQAGHQE